MVISLALPVPAIRGHFGSELQTFQTQVRADQVVQLLGHDPRSKGWSRLPDDLAKMYHYLQRATTKARREGTAQYIEERIGPNAIAIGAFPSISIGMVRPPRFEASDPRMEAVGTLHLDLSDTNRRVLLDGLARVTGALDLMEEQEEGVQVGEWFTFPVTFYAPRETVLTLAQLGQLFHDFNFKQTKVNPNQAIALDQSDIYIQLANKIGASPMVQRFGGMEERAASLGAKSKALVVQRVLVRFVRGACEGRAFQKSNLSHAEHPNLTPLTFREVREQIEEFIEALATRMGDERFRDRDSLHLSAPGWQVLGLIFHDLHYRIGAGQLTVKAYDDVLSRLAALDWSRYNPDWIGMVGEPERDKVTQQVVTDAQGRPRVSLSRAGDNTIVAIWRYVRKQTGIDQMLAEDGEEGQGQAQMELATASPA